MMQRFRISKILLWQGWLYLQRKKSGRWDEKDIKV